MPINQIKYSVEPSDKPNFTHKVVAETGDHEHALCYINPVFQNDQSIAFAIKDALTKSGIVLNLEI